MLVYYYQTAVVFDAAPIGKIFGSVLADVNTIPYNAGDTVVAQFVGANPRVWSYPWESLCSDMDV